MSKFLDRVDIKIEQYKRDFPKRSNVIALKLIWWSFMCVVEDIFSEKHTCDMSQKNIKIAFVIVGGLGDILISSNYIKYFRDFVGDKNIEIDVFANSKSVSSFLKENDIVNNIKYVKHEEDAQLSPYNLVIKIVRFPEIIYQDKEFIKKRSLKLANLIAKYEEFKNNYYKVFKNPPYEDSISKDISLAYGQKRVQQPDIYKIFNISENYAIKLDINADAKEVLEKFGLLGSEFITINRSTGNKEDAENTKLWEYEKYNQLTKILKEKYPEIKLVQIGDSLKSSKIIENLDVNCIEKTNFEELKVLLKCAKLHIDGEGGLVHLRHALGGGKSVVLFGPTSMEFFGYTKNVNISSEVACKIACEWVDDRWNTRCIKTKSTQSACMQAISPEEVFERIEGEI